MPELPEVETIARELRPLVLGATIETFWTDWPRAIKHPDPDAFAAGVIGRTIADVSRRAKWLVLELSGGMVAALQVKMTGQVFVLPRGTPRDAHVHLVFGLEDGRELLVRDVRKFARVALYRRDEAGRALGADEDADVFDQLGPEPLDPAFTLARFRALVRGRRGRLKPLLVDQAFLAGVGNIYADESLWRARLHPLRSASSLRPPDERALYVALREVLAEAIEHRGSSVDDYTAPEGDGAMQDRLLVYQRTGQPCARCGRPIKRFVLGIRATHFCSWCQRLPAADRTPGNLALLAGARSTTGRRGTRWSELPTGEGAVGARTEGAVKARGEGAIGAPGAGRRTSTGRARAAR
jgi:formamidopyrimidine-DNA glycosylase